MASRKRHAETTTESTLQELLAALYRIAAASPKHLAAILVIVKSVLAALDGS